MIDIFTCIGIMLCIWWLATRCRSMWGFWPKELYCTKRKGHKLPHSHGHRTWVESQGELQ